jgi:zinc transporter ZupT
MMPLVLLVLGSVPVAVATSHSHGGGAFEWAGIFETPQNTYRWLAEKVDGAYADPGMQIVLLSSAQDTEAAFHALEAEAETSFGTTCINVNNGGTLVPQANTCYQLNFDQNDYRTVFTVDARNAAHIAFFCEHFPTEFERDAHFFKDLAGEDIEPIHTIPEEAPAPTPEEPETPWGNALGGAVIVNLCTLVGVIFLVPILGVAAKNNPRFFNCATSGFAAGALLACAFFLLCFEATHLVSYDDGEAVATAWWGCAILAGYLVGSLSDTGHSLVAGKKPAAGEDAAAGKPEETQETQEAKNAAGKAEEPPVIDIDSGELAVSDNGGKGDEKVVPAVAAEENEKIAPEKSPRAENRARILSSVLLGDFMHNLCDGIFIAAAFRGCGGSFGWGVTAGSAYHEIAQEIADYFVLTDPEQGGLSPFTALALNFISGLGVIVGAVIICAQDEVENQATGIMLAFGGGVYIQIAATECMGRVHSQANTPKLRLAALFMFAVGAVLIGLILLDHEHCVPEVAGAEGAAADPHAGHNHR